MKRIHRYLAKVLSILIFAGCIYPVMGLEAQASDLKPYFDTTAYADAYPDLKATYGYNADELLNHYFTYGIAEGRIMSGSFDVQGYRALYPDLEAVYNDNWRAYAEHYVKYGIAEGRENGVNTAPAGEMYVFQKKGTITDTYFSGVKWYWDLIPENTRKDFSAQGWHIEVTSEELYLAGYTKILAYTDFEHKTLFIGNKDATAVVHEMGHYIDWRKGMCHKNISDDVWQSEKNAAIELGGSPGSINANKQEYFAECYWLYIKNNEGLKNACPQTYAFIQANML